MLKLIKRPIIIQDLINAANYISAENLDAGDRLLYAAEDTFRQIAQFPGIGRLSGFIYPEATQIRQFPIKGFRNYLILYQINPENIEIIRVLHGAQDLESILIEETTDNEQ